MLFCNVKLVNWEEGNYNVNDHPNPRGEIHVGGDNIAVGYYKKPDLTMEEFYEENGKRWFRTGDIGEISPDGRLKVISSCCINYNNWKFMYHLLPFFFRLWIEKRIWLNFNMENTFH